VRERKTDCYDERDGLVREGIDLGHGLHRGLHLVLGGDVTRRDQLLGEALDLAGKLLQKVEELGEKDLQAVMEDVVGVLLEAERDAPTPEPPPIQPVLDRLWTENMVPRLRGSFRVVPDGDGQS
jgi:hypothetical protein